MRLRPQGPLLSLRAIPGGVDGVVNDSPAIGSTAAWLFTFLPFLLGIVWIAFLPKRPRLHRIRGERKVLSLRGWSKAKKRQSLLEPLSARTIDSLARASSGLLRDWSQVSRRPRVHVPRTVAATVRNMGFPALRYRQAHLDPSYLVLIEADRDEEYGVLWAERMEEAGAEITLYRVLPCNNPDDLPMVVTVNDDRAPAFGLDNLPRAARDQRLVLVSDGQFLVTPCGTWRPWVSAVQFAFWRHRVVFSPREPRDLVAGNLEVLSRPIVPGDDGFLVLPQDEGALSSWSQWLVTGHFPEVVLPTEERFPRLLAAMPPNYWLADEPEPAPTADQVAILMSQLHLYLGHNGFYWLCCCAVPPVLNSDFVLLLGEEYFAGTGLTPGSEQFRGHLRTNYRLLSRLPWLQRSRLPDWLRLALLTRLPRALEEEVRRVVDRRLSKLKPLWKSDHPADLAFALPNIRDQYTERAQSTTTESLFLGFMKGLSAYEMSIQVPDAWASWIPKVPKEFSSRGRNKFLRRSNWLMDRFSYGGMRTAKWLQAAAVGILGTVAIAIVIWTLDKTSWPVWLRRVFELPFEEIATHSLISVSGFQAYLLAVVAGATVLCVPLGGSQMLRFERALRRSGSARANV